MKLHKSVLLITGLISAMHATGMQLQQNNISSEQEQLPSMIELISAQDRSVFVPRESALQAATLATILNTMQGTFEEAQTKSVMLKEIATATLEIIGEIMKLADRHGQLKGKAFLDAINKEITINDEQIIPVLNACNFLDYAPGIRLIAMEMINKPAIINHVIKSIQTNQLSDDTAKQIAKIYYLITQKDLEGVDKKPIVTIGFSIRDYLEYLPDVIKKRKTETELDLSGLRLNDTDGLRDIPDLNNLQKLYLHDNQLTQLPATLFNGLNNLQKLYLHDNQLTQLPATLFNGLNNLQILYLYDNQLTELPATLFNGLNNLQLLYLYDNQLTELPATLFNGLNNLQALLLNNNQLMELPATLFNGLNNLQYLSLSNNQLTDAKREQIRNALPGVDIF
jgi:Leucine-rich repeat (LRR) protein